MRDINNHIHWLVIVNVWFENVQHWEESEKASISTAVLPNPINKKRGRYGNLGETRSNTLEQIFVLFSLE